jgi:DmsE family decaheme c-type cytochrome
MAFHHKVNEGLVQCSDCHDPHGTGKKNGAKLALEQNDFCVRCHRETAGPFVYEHAAVRSEGCSACHVPHGGPNPHLLNRATVDTICLQCHFPPPSRTTSTPAVPYHNQGVQSQSCTSCHASIHGSNISRIFLKHGD